MMTILLSLALAVLALVVLARLLLFIYDHPWAYAFILVGVILTCTALSAQEVDGMDEACAGEVVAFAAAVEMTDVQLYRSWAAVVQGRRMPKELVLFTTSMIVARWLMWAELEPVTPLQCQTQVTAAIIAQAAQHPELNP